MLGKGFEQIESTPLQPPYLYPEKIRDLEQRAQRYLNRHGVRMDDFTDLYGEKNVRTHKDYVDRHIREFEHSDGKRIATIFEAVFLEHGEQSNWFGDKAEVIKTSVYDDIKNGVDTVLEIVENDNTAAHLALGIDVTFSNQIGGKLERIRSEIEGGTLAEIKYFKSDRLGIRGEMKQVPRLVIGVDIKTVDELARLWDENKKSALATHPIQLQIIEEIIIQLETFADYAERIGRSNLTEIYDRALRIAKNIYTDRKSQITDPGTRDHGFHNLKNRLEIFK